MAQLIVRNLDDEVIRRLKKKAVDNGRSTEAEHRDILCRALLGSRRETSLKQWLREIPESGTDRDFAREAEKPRKIRL